MAENDPFFLNESSIMDVSGRFDAESVLFIDRRGESTGGQIPDHAHQTQQNYGSAAPKKSADDSLIQLAPHEVRQNERAGNPNPFLKRGGAQGSGMSGQNSNANNCNNQLPRGGGASGSSGPSGPSNMQNQQSSGNPSNYHPPPRPMHSKPVEQVMVSSSMFEPSVAEEDSGDLDMVDALGGLDSISHGRGNLDDYEQQGFPRHNHNSPGLYQGHDHNSPGLYNNQQQQHGIGSRQGSSSTTTSRRKQVVLSSGSVEHIPPAAEEHSEVHININPTENYGMADDSFNYNRPGSEHGAGNATVMTDSFQDLQQQQHQDSFVVTRARKQREAERQGMQSGGMGHQSGIGGGIGGGGSGAVRFNDRIDHRSPRLDGSYLGTPQLRGRTTNPKKNTPMPVRYMPGRSGSDSILEVDRTGIIEEEPSFMGDIPQQFQQPQSQPHQSQQSLQAQRFANEIKHFPDDDISDLSIADSFVTAADKSGYQDRSMADKSDISLRRSTLGGPLPTNGNSNSFSNSGSGFSNGGGMGGGFGGGPGGPGGPGARRVTMCGGGPSPRGMNAGIGGGASVGGALVPGSNTAARRAQRDLRRVNSDCGIGFPNNNNNNNNLNNHNGQSVRANSRGGSFDGDAVPPASEPHRTSMRRTPGINGVENNGARPRGGSSSSNLQFNNNNNSNKNNYPQAPNSARGPLFSSSRPPPSCTSASASGGAGVGVGVGAPNRRTTLATTSRPTPSQFQNQNGGVGAPDNSTGNRASCPTRMPGIPPTGTGKPPAPTANNNMSRKRSSDGRSRIQESSQADSMFDDDDSMIDSCTKPPTRLQKTQPGQQLQHGNRPRQNSGTNSGSNSARGSSSSLAHQSPGITNRGVVGGVGPNGVNGAASGGGGGQHPLIRGCSVEKRGRETRDQAPMQARPPPPGLNRAGSSERRKSKGFNPALLRQNSAERRARGLGTLPPGGSGGGISSGGNNPFLSGSRTLTAASSATNNGQNSNFLDNSSQAEPPSLLDQSNGISRLGDSVFDESFLNASVASHILRPKKKMKVDDNEENEKRCYGTPVATSMGEQMPSKFQDSISTKYEHEVAVGREDGMMLRTGSEPSVSVSSSPPVPGITSSVFSSPNILGNINLASSTISKSGGSTGSTGSLSGTLADRIQQQWSEKHLPSGVTDAIAAAQQSAVQQNTDQQQLLQQFEKSQQEVSRLTNENTRLSAENAKLTQNLVQKDEELGRKESQIAGYQSHVQALQEELHRLRGGAGGALGAGGSSGGNVGINPGSTGMKGGVGGVGGKVGSPSGSPLTSPLGSPTIGGGIGAGASGGVQNQNISTGMTTGGMKGTKGQSFRCGPGSPGGCPGGLGGFRERVGSKGYSKGSPKGSPVLTTRGGGYGPAISAGSPRLDAWGGNSRGGM